MKKLFIALFAYSVTALAVPDTQEIKIAFIGDTEAGDGFASVLNMITSEKPDAVMINGDFGYNSSASAWKSKLISTFNINAIPVIGAIGNHDVLGNTDNYINIFAGLRNTINGLTTKCTGTPGVKQNKDTVIIDEVCTFGNVSVISSGIGQVLTPAYFETRLENKLKTSPQENWKVVGYHYTLASMTPGLKGDESTYKFFDLIRQNGAIGVQAHTHSAVATCPIISPFVKGKDVQCHPDFKALESRFVGLGTGIFMDSSLGGKGARNRSRCKSPTEKNCSHMVDIITADGYTRTDGLKNTNFNRLGAMFIVFNAGGDPNLANAYYRSVDGQVIFRFQIHRNGGGL